MREKLIELLESVVSPKELLCDGEMLVSTARVADHLIANGVIIVPRRNIATHADRIRAMSDEELAEFIRDVSYECQDAHWGSKCQCCDFPWCSSDQTLVWLQQPAEGTP